MSKLSDKDARAAQEKAQRDIMLNDLGAGRREEILTTDYNDDVINLQEIYNSRDCVRPGTVAHQNATANAAALHQWSTVAPDEGPQEINIANGQGHRSRLPDNQRPSRRTGRHLNHNDNHHSVSRSQQHSYQNSPPLSRSSPFLDTSDRSGAPRQNPSYDPNQPSDPPRRSRCTRGNRTRYVVSQSRSPPAPVSRPPQNRGGNRNLNRILSNINQQMRQPEASSNYTYPSSILRSTVTPSDTRSGSVTANTKKPRLSVVSGQDWGRESLKVNPLPSPTAPLTLSNPTYNPRAFGTKIVTTPKLELAALSAPAFDSATPTYDTEETATRVPKRVKLGPLQPLLSNVAPFNRTGTVTDEAVKSRSRLALTNSEGSQNTVQDSPTPRNDAQENLFPVPVNAADMPEIQHDPRDPLATQVREEVLSSADNFWTWKFGRNNEVSPPHPQQTRAPPILPSRPIIPEVSYPSVPETQPSRSEDTIPKLRQKMMQKAAPTASTHVRAETLVLRPRSTTMQQHSQTASTRSSALGSATLRPPTNRTQWFNPSQEHLSVCAGSSSIVDDHPASSAEDNYSTQGNRDSVDPDDDKYLTHVVGLSTSRGNDNSIARDDDSSVAEDDEYGHSVTRIGDDVVGQGDEDAIASQVDEGDFTSRVSHDDIATQAVDDGVATSTDDHLASAVDDHFAASDDNYPASPADSGGITDLTQRLSSFSLTPTLPSVVQESDEDESSSDDMVMIDGYPVSIRSLRTRLDMSRKEFRERYNPDA